MLARSMSWTCHGTDNASMADALCASGIVKSPHVEAAIRAVDRAKCVPATEEAYMDAPQLLGYNATISAPHMHAHCLELLADHLQPGACVLDVGAGSGYLTAVFAHMVCSGGAPGLVVGVEHIPQLVRSARRNLTAAAPWAAKLMERGQLRLVEGDGRDGYKAAAPYDVIHVGAAAPSVPVALLAQLKPGGRLVVPVGLPRQQQQLLLVDKGMDGKLLQQAAMKVMYVPLTARDKQLQR